jgi:hypothetical protein
MCNIIGDGAVNVWVEVARHLIIRGNILFPQNKN